MNLQARIDYLTDMLESAKYECNVNVNPVKIAFQFSEVAHDLESIIATLENIRELKQE